jgi:hypothetical protein
LIKLTQVLNVRLLNVGANQVRLFNVVPGTTAHDVCSFQAANGSTSAAHANLITKQISKRSEVERFLNGKRTAATETKVLTKDNSRPPKIARENLVATNEVVSEPILHRHCTYVVLKRRLFAKLDYTVSKQLQLD